MNLAETKSLIQSGKYDGTFSRLYTDVDAAKMRYSAACNEYRNLYGESENVRLFSAPGRTEIGGNHTDHQHGCVLAGSVNLDVIAVVCPNGENIVRIKSAGYPMDEINLDELDASPAEYGHASALIRGVCAAFKNNGYQVGGFNAYTTSNVLKGSGLSSSAAFEVLVSNILNGLFNNAAVDAVSIAKYSQFAEREY
ncbi:MAG: galactokinase, partial [Clostridia bacterium]|nr:galactokinase [Clostridia bacterium]